MGRIRVWDILPVLSKHEWLLGRPKLPGGVHAGFPIRLLARGAQWVQQEAPVVPVTQMRCAVQVPISCPAVASKTVPTVASSPARGMYFSGPPQVRALGGPEDDAVLAVPRGPGGGVPAAMRTGVQAASLWEGGKEVHWGRHRQQQGCRGGARAKWATENNDSGTSAEVHGRRGDGRGVREALSQTA